MRHGTKRQEDLYLLSAWQHSCIRECPVCLTPLCCDDEQIWVRNYQILEQQAANALEAHKAKKTSGQAVATSLIEIGPRFVLSPIRIFRGSFGGQTLYQNQAFISPNEVRAEQRRDKGQTYDDRKKSQKKRKERLEQIMVPEDPLASVFR
jgi:ribosome biogenesis protein BRX1